MVGTPEWMDDAACSDADTNIFYSDDAGEIAEARNLCANCPVWKECLAYAEENNEKYGIWGGFLPSERRAKK